MTRTFYWEVDSGHSWLVVGMSEIESLGLKTQISEYSYIGDLGCIAYLEEDIDAPLFLNTLKIAYYRKSGNKLETRFKDMGTFHNISPIRRLNTFTKKEELIYEANL